MLLDDVLESRALDQLHPQAGEAGLAGRAEHRDDAAVPDLGEQPAFVDDDQRLIALGRFGDQLERDFPIELRIPGAVDDAVGAAADHFAQREMGPDVAGEELGRPLARRRRHRAVQPGDLGDDLQRVQDTPIGRRRLRPGGGPVDGVTIGNGLSQPGEIDGIHRRHCKSARPSRPWRWSALLAARGYSDSDQPVRYSRRRNSFALSEFVTRMLAAS